MKNVIICLFCFFMLIIGGILFPYNEDFYTLLKLPSFILNPSLISYVWIFLYLLISIAVCKIIKKVNILINKDYMYTLVTNYLAIELVPFVFFYLMSPLLLFIMTLITFVSSIFLFIETNKIDKKTSYFLIPYNIFNLYSLVISFFVFMFNF